MVFGLGWFTGERGGRGMSGNGARSLLPPLPNQNFHFQKLHTKNMVFCSSRARQWGGGEGVEEIVSTLFKGA